MHEIGIAQSALDAAVKAAEAGGAARIHRLRLRIGTMSGVAPEALSFAFDAVRQGTIAAEALLEIEVVPVAYWCATCKREFTAGDLPDECPTCHAFSSEMRHGLELELASLEIS